MLFVYFVVMKRTQSKDDKDKEEINKWVWAWLVLKWLSFKTIVHIISLLASNCPVLVTGLSIFKTGW